MILDLYILGAVALLTAICILGMKREDRRWQAQMRARYGEPLPSRDFQITGGQNDG